ncbi:oxidoreductase [Pseudomonas sp. BN414]|uniref:PDR/VanB family oxidoreductase n=1 Tax=unclassified Pseudomonas TaxID=196821 RepID=UPI0024570144|nr:MULTISPECIES: PDR/VanB family oxidoreductase [unclassified Pseudomonas]MDH4568253.1 oxidoreductase [Pseudomonas sp. BN414]MDH4580688.1 oxidoreductase [Pseudomonas sp. BN415]
MMEVVVTAIAVEAEGIKSFEFRRADGAHLPAFSAGSHIDVRTPDGHQRQYSLCNSQDERDRYLVGVLKEPNSRGGSKSMHEQLEVGARVEISEPKNLFPLHNATKRSLLFAGGIGITPILCMAERLATIGADFELHYCSRSDDRAAFVDRIKSASFASRVHFHFDTGPEEQKLQASVVLGEPGDGVHLYVCGPGGFMDFILNTARDSGWSEDHLHREYFAAQPASAPGADQAFEVQVSSTGEVYTVPAEMNVVQALAEHGIDIPYSCEQGICGTCTTRVLGGEPDHRDMFLSAEEKAANDQFMPCCSRAKSSRLILDL